MGLTLEVVAIFWCGGLDCDDFNPRSAFRAPFPF